MEKIEVNNDKLNEIFRNFSENDTIKINKDQLYEYFQMYLNNEKNSNQQLTESQKEKLGTKAENKIENSGENKEIDLTEKEEKKENIKILKDVEKKNDINSDEKEKNQIKINQNIQENNNDNNEKIKNKINDFDEMPIGGGFNNFNDLFEKELSKYQKEIKNDKNIESNIKPKFKYVPKQKNELLFKIPPKTKKYKYYTDNFKIKLAKKENNKSQPKTKINTKEKNNKKNNIIDDELIIERYQDNSEDAITINTFKQLNKAETESKKNNINKISINKSSDISKRNNDNKKKGRAKSGFDDENLLNNNISKKFQNMTEIQNQNFLQEIHDLIQQNPKNKNNDTLNIEDAEANEIFKMISKKLNTQKNLKSNNNKKSTVNKNSLNTFHFNTNKNFENSENIIEPIIINHYDYKVNELVEAKQTELENYLGLLQKEDDELDKLKTEYENLKYILNENIGKIGRKKQELKKKYEDKKEEKIKQIESERKTHIQQMNILSDFPGKSQMSEIIYLKDEINKLNDDLKDKQEYYMNTIDKLNKQLNETNKQNIELKNQLANLENKKKIKKTKNNISKNIIKNKNDEINNKDEKNYETKKENNKEIANIEISNNEISNIEINEIDCMNNNDNNIINQNNDINKNKKLEKDIHQIVNKYLNKKNNKNLNKETKTTKHDYNDDIFDMIFLPEYHSPLIKGCKEIIKEQISKDKSTITRNYASGKKEILIPNVGIRQEIFPDGYQIIYYKNKDIKQIYPNGREVYLYSENNTVSTKFPNGLLVFKFSNGQIEKYFPGGKKVVEYTDGTVKNIYKEGIEEVFFSDGSSQKVDENGIITAIYVDGVKDIIYPEGNKDRYYPDGRCEHILCESEDEEDEWSNDNNDEELEFNDDEEIEYDDNEEINFE